MRTVQITINSERARGEATCQKCRHLTIGPRGAVSCAVGGPLTPCDRFKDASVDRTFRRALSARYPTSWRWA